jgi:hypothetical protein
MKARNDMPRDQEEDKKPVNTPSTRRAEEIANDDGREPGRRGTGTTGANRPAGTSDARDSTAVNPDDEDPIDPASPKLPPA